jgi:ABC-type sugar transport system permease subunit
MTRSSFTNALIGAVVSVVLSFIPFSPVIGGAVAGYLEGEDGVKVGGISGALAAIPMILVFVVGVSIFAIVPEGSAMGFLVIVGLVGLIALLYTVLLSALGGFVGVYLADYQRQKREESPVEGTA